MIQSVFKKSLLHIAGICLGGIAGYVYWKLEGCKSGTCMITSNPLHSTIYFGVLGFFIVNIFVPISFKQNKKGHPNDAP